MNQETELVIECKSDEVETYVFEREQDHINLKIMRIYKRKTNAEVKKALVL